MLAYTFYETDSRVIRYAEALAQRGDHVDVIALRKDGQPSDEILNGMHLFRIQERIIDEKGKFDYLFRLIKFFIKSAIFITQKNRGEPYDIIHVHSVPDFEVFAATLPKLTGSKVILDIHDLVPEFYASKFKKNKQSFIYKTLLIIERVSCRFADHVIAANHIWEKTLTGRSVRKEHCTTILNYPKTSVFHKSDIGKENGKFIFLYPGSLSHHQGLDVAIKAFSLIKNDFPEAEFHIYGEGPSEPALKQLASRLGVSERILFKREVPLERIASIIANADIGVVPKRNDGFGGEAFSTKILEFMISGVPVILSATRIDRYYFNDAIVKFFNPDDEKDLATCMLTLTRDKALRDRLSENALRFVENYTWEKRKCEYLDLVDSLLKQKKGLY